VTSSAQSLLAPHSAEVLQEKGNAILGNSIIFQLLLKTLQVKVYQDRIFYRGSIDLWAKNQIIPETTFLVKIINDREAK